MKGRYFRLLWCAGCLLTVPTTTHSDVESARKVSRELRRLLNEHRKTILAYKKESRRDIQKPKIVQKEQVKKPSISVVKSIKPEPRYARAKRMLRRKKTKNVVVAQKERKPQVVKKKVKKQRVVVAKKKVAAKPKKLFVARKKKTPRSKIELRTAIAVAGKIREKKAAEERKQLKTKLNDFIADVSHSESLEEVVNLLDLEIKLIRSILGQKTGQEVQALLSKRNKLLHSAIKTSVSAYEMIMKFATNSNKKSRPSVAEKKQYLSHVFDVLNQYRAELGYKQYCVKNSTSALQQHPEVRTSVNAYGSTVSEESLEVFPYFCPIGRTSGVNKVNDTVVFRTNFERLWSSITKDMNRNELITLLDDVLLLMGREGKMPVSRKSKKFSAKRKIGQDIMTNINTSGVVASNRARVLFGTLRDAAAINTVSVGSWNPNLYEKNMKLYKRKLMSFKKKCDKLLPGGSGKACGSCCQFQESLDLLVSSIVLSAFSA